MFGRNCLVIMLVFISSLVFGAGVANACWCVNDGSVLGEFGAAKSVILARTVSVERAEDSRSLYGIASAKLEVIKVYKGSFKPRDQMTFAQGGGGDCIWTFKEESIGQEYLFYLSPSDKFKGMWHGPVCSRSGRANQAASDLLYLDHMEEMRGKTRISGMVDFRHTDSVNVAGMKIRITGAKDSYELRTDANGVFEIYDVPPGKYTVEAETPKGWKPADEQKIPIEVLAQKHVDLKLYFEIDNSIGGTISDPNGNPLGNVCIHAVDPDPKKPRGLLFDCTNADGSFAIKNLPVGNYLLVVNDDGKVTSSEPFKTFYYPREYDRTKATAIYISAGESIDGVNITTPEAAATVTLNGTLYDSDGRPVADEFVGFEADQAPSGVDGEAHTKTDANGKFSLKVLKDLRGSLFGFIYPHLYEYEKCPKLEEAMKKAGGSDVRSPAQLIQPDANSFDLELKFTFPKCAKSPD